MPAVSRRAAGIGAMELADLLRLGRRTGAIDLALGIPAGEPPAEAVAAAIAALRSGGNQYADPAGLDRLRAAIAAELAVVRDVTVDPDAETTVVAGATEGVLTARLAVTDPGDEVILTDPGFENYAGVVRLAGAVPVFAPLRRPDWRLDAAAVRALVTSRTRAVLLNNPHNPTGRVFEAAELAELGALCDTAGLTLVLDEVYDRFVFGGRAHLSPLGGPAPELAAFRHRSIVIGSLSKAYRMSGWRIGFAVTPPAITPAFRGVHERTTLGAAHPLQWGAAAAAGGADVPGPDGFQSRRDLVVARLSGLGFGVRPPEGGCFVLADARPLGVDGAELARALPESAGVVVAPGTPFFTRPEEGRRWVRVALMRDRETLDAGLARIGAFLARTPRGEVPVRGSA